MSTNIVIISGNLGKDPELKYSPSGSAVAKFSVAVSEKFKNRAGEQQERTEWINVVAFGNQAETLGKYLTKGSKVLVTGKLQTSSWEDKQSGEKKFRTEVVASNVEFLDRKSSTQVDSEEWS